MAEPKGPFPAVFELDGFVRVSGAGGRLRGLPFGFGKCLVFTRRILRALVQGSLDDGSRRRTLFGRRGRNGFGPSATATLAQRPLGRGGWLGLL